SAKSVESVGALILCNCGRSPSAQSVAHGSTTGGCPAALRLALREARSVVLSAVQRGSTTRNCSRARPQAATWLAVGATSARCIAIAAASIAALTLSSVGGPAGAAPPPKPPPKPPNPPRGRGAGASESTRAL